MRCNCRDVPCGGTGHVTQHVENMVADRQRLQRQKFRPNQNLGREPVGGKNRRSWFNKSDLFIGSN